MIDIARPKKDGQFISAYLDRNLFDRLCYYAEDRGQTKTLAIERILKKHFDDAGVPKQPLAEKHSLENS